MPAIPPADPADSAVADVLAKAGHDLRQPFQAMRLFLHLLNTRLTEPGQKELAARLEQALDSGEGMLNNVLEYAALEAGRVRVDIQDAAEVGPVLARLVEEYTDEAAEKGLEIRLVPSAARLRTDPVLLERLLRRLVANAVRHGAEGRILLGLRRRGGMAEIQVWNSGAIPADKREEIFAPFVRLAGPRGGGPERRQGLGLGLTIVRNAAALLGHEVVVHPATGQDRVCFAVRVPLHGADPSGTRPAEAGTATAAAGVPLIAVVEDDRLQLAALEGMLQEWGMQPVCAGTLDGLMKALAQAGRPPDLLITDYRLPDGITGPVVMEKVRADHGPGIGGLLMTGDDHPDTLAEAAAARLEMVQKPINPTRLRRAIERALGRAPP